MLANDEHPVVKLPQNADSVHPGPASFNHTPPDVVVHLQKVSPPENETSPAELVDSERSQSSPTGSSLDAGPLCPAGQLQTPSNGSLDVVRWSRFRCVDYRLMAFDAGATRGS
jgi:hypothetical protein